MRMSFEVFKYGEEQEPQLRFARAPYLRLTMLPHVPERYRFWRLMGDYAAGAAIAIGVLAFVGLAAGVRW